MSGFISVSASVEVSEDKIDLLDAAIAKIRPRPSKVTAQEWRNKFFKEGAVNTAKKLMEQQAEEEKQKEAKNKVSEFEADVR